METTPLLMPLSSPTSMDVDRSIKTIKTTNPRRFGLFTFLNAEDHLAKSELYLKRAHALLDERVTYMKPDEANSLVTRREQYVLAFPLCYLSRSTDLVLQIDCTLTCTI